MTTTVHPPGMKPTEQIATIDLTRTKRGQGALLRFMPIGVLVLLIVSVSLANPNFLRPNSLLTALDSSAPLLVMAVGAMLVILCGSIDLSVAALASMCSVLVAMWVPALGGWAIPAAALVGALAGCIQGLVHVIAQIPSFIVTLGGMAVWSGVGLIVSGASTIGVTGSELEWAFSRIGPAKIPSAALIALAVAGVIGLLLWLTPLKRWFEAIGNAEPAASLAGVPVPGIKLGAFTVSGLCAGLAGGLLVARTYSGAPSLADSLLLPVVAAIVVGGVAITGGFGGVGRTLIGVLIITVLRVGLSVAGVDPSFEQIVYGSLVILAVSLTIDRSKFAFVK